MVGSILSGLILAIFLLILFLSGFYAGFMLTRDLKFKS